MSKHKKHGKEKVATVRREFHQGTLHSGSKKGPVVTNPAQAKAIAMSEAGMREKKRPYRKSIKQIFGR